jgi:hypothetical protein
MWSGALNSAFKSCIPERWPEETRQTGLGKVLDRDKVFADMATEGKINAAEAARAETTPIVAR